MEGIGKKENMGVVEKESGKVRVNAVDVCDLLNACGGRLSKKLFV